MFQIFSYLTYFLVAANAAPAPAPAARISTSLGVPYIPASQARNLPQQSVQILYGRYPNSGHYLWSVWVGPQGVGVDPCNPGPFKVVQYSVAQKVENSSIENPPSPPKETWDKFTLEYRGERCLIRGYGQEGSPLFQCGNTLGLDFNKDLQFDDPVFLCSNGYKYHRGWTVEYDSLPNYSKTR